MTPDFGSVSYPMPCHSGHMPIPNIGREPLNGFYQADLKRLRSIADKHGINKRGSVEVLRASLIHRVVLHGVDLSWEGIQSKSNAELGDLLRIFGIKASGSHKDRRQRLWLHVTQDVNKLKIETLGLASREELVELCKRLELPTKGPRTLLIGQVEEVLNSQNKAWGKIKRSLRRSGLTSKPNLKTTNFQDDDNEKSIFVREATTAVLENARQILTRMGPKDGLGSGLEILASNPSNFARMVQTVGLVRGALWSRDATSFLLKMMHARGYPTTVEHASEAIHRAALAIADDWVHGDSPSIRTYGITSLNERFDHAGIEDLRARVDRLKLRST